MKNRIFTFGCSFVEYAWPTWADMLLYKNEGKNLGLCGTGVESMLYRFMDADKTYKFTPHDTIVMIFTSPLRWDLIINSQWQMYGQVITSDLIKYEDKLYCLDGLMYKTYYSMKIIDDLIRAKGLNRIYGSMNNPYENIGNYFEVLDISSDTQDLIKYVSEYVKMDLIDFNTFMYGQGSKSWSPTKRYSSGQNDYHPRPTDHYRWLTNELTNHLNFSLNVDTADIEKMEIEIDKVDEMQDLNALRNAFPGFFENRTFGYIYSK
jgi:hypothetical protein